MTLPSVQHLLADAFRRLEPVIDDPDLSRTCAEHVTGNDRLSPAEQVDIYRRQFWARHLDSLREDYPGLAYVAGDDGFEAFCRGYLMEHPPRTPSLRDLGADIVRFAEAWDGFATERRPLALQMVRYEHAFVELFDGPDLAPLDPARLAEVAPDAWDVTRIDLHPLLALLTLEHPVHRLRYAVRDGETPDLPTDGSMHHLVLFRKELVIHYEEVTPTALSLLQALREGQALAPAFEAVVAARGEAAAEELGSSVGAWFRQWAAWGWFVGVRGS